jgi:hypothetical protein
MAIHSTNKQQKKAAQRPGYHPKIFGLNLNVSLLKILDDFLFSVGNLLKNFFSMVEFQNNNLLI